MTHKIGSFFKQRLFFILIWYTIVGLVIVKADPNEESSIIDGETETTDVIETSPTNELKENGNDFLESALEIVGSILSNWFSSDSDKEVEGSRTFGKIRRLQMALIPLLFKFGVISAMIAALLFLMLKAIFLLKALLVLNLGGIIAKLIAIKAPYHSQPQWSYSHSFLPTAPVESWSRTSEPTVTPSKEIHVHIHNSGQSSGSSDSSWNNEPYGAYSNYVSSQVAPVPIPLVKQQQQQYLSYPSKQV